MSEPAAGLQARGISFAYDGSPPALRGVNFSAARGEFVALLGANGSGKTTLMKVLLRLLQPQQGAVLLDGRDIRELRPAELYQNVAMVSQNPDDQLFAPTVEEDVAFGPRNLGLDAAEVRRRVTEALEAVDAGHLRRRPIHHLSFGEQKRACLAGALAMKPAMLLLDEPTAGLDPQCERHMVELLAQLNGKLGMTIVMATHSVDLLGLTARRVCVLNGGQVLADGPLEQVFADREVIARASLRLPYVAQLFEELRREGRRVGEALPLTVAQATAALLERLVSLSAKEKS